MAPASKMVFASGDRVGDYEILAPLGAGGMGSVYRVRHAISQRIEALKLILPNPSGTPEMAERFLREKPPRRERDQYRPRAEERGAYNAIAAKSTR